MSLTQLMLMDEIIENTDIYIHTIYPNIQHQYGKRGRRGHDRMATGFTTITTDVVSSNLDQGEVYNIM